MQVKYKSRQEEITEEGTYSIGDSITITLDVKDTSKLWFGWSETLPDGTVIILGQ